MKYEKFLITGCGRSGTGFYSRMMRINGYPCGHETYIDFRGIKTLNFIAESSWLAVPHIDKIPDDYYIIRTIRDPYKVIKSFFELSVMSSANYRSVYYRYIRNHLPISLSENALNQRATEVNNIANYYMGWNELFGTKIGNRKHTTLCFEEIIKNNSYNISGINFKIPSQVVNDKRSSKTRKIEVAEIKNILGKAKCEHLRAYYNLHRENK